MSYAPQAALGRAMRGRKRGHRLIALVVVLVVIAALLEVADIVARHYSEDTVATHAMRASGAASAGASISGWPIIYDVLVDKSVPHVTVNLDDVPVGPLHVQHLEVQLTDVGIDLSAAFSDRTVRVTSISRALVTAEVTAAELSQAAGRAITLPGGGVVRTTVGGHVIVATVEVAGHVLSVHAGGRSLLSVDLAKNRLIPVCAMTLVVLTGEVRATCSVAPVPHSLLAAVSG